MANLDSRQSYDEHLSRLKQQFGSSEAFTEAIGGEFSAMGLLEFHLLVSQGLKENHSVIDVGCGSGRLACRLACLPKLTYLGTDVVAELLAHASQLAQRPDWNFSVATGTTIPAENATADFICFFSVFTHLSHEDTYRYLAEAKRVLKPGGKIVFSFLEFRIPCHWEIFENSLNHQRADLHLNQFMDRDAIHTWAAKLGLTTELLVDGDKPHIPLPETITLENGRKMEGLGNLGQSVAVLKKPSGASSEENPASLWTQPSHRKVSPVGSSEVQGRIPSQLPPAILKPGSFVNFGVRGAVGSGSESMIVGFVVQDGEKYLLLRAVGPGLSAFGLSNTLGSPQITIVDQTKQVVGANAGVRKLDDSDKLHVENAGKSAGAFPIGENDAALVIRVPPGAYSLLITSTDGGSGIALAEIYDLKTWPTSAGKNAR